MSKEKRIGLLVNFIVYVCAFAVGFLPYFFMTRNGNNPYISMLVFTVVSTLFVLIVSFFYKNTSLYDPYWSVAPFVMTVLHIIRYGFYTVNALIFAIIMFWYSFRLTRNWALTYKGLDNKYEDWRYAQYRHSLPGWKFQFVNIVGLNYVPTFVVYSALLPGLMFIESSEFNFVSLIGLIIMIFGPILEIIADFQVHKFIKDTNDHSKVCNYGLWNYSRHPNYLGELTFWFGIAIAYLPGNISSWYWAFGFVPMILLFLFISIPMMEKHNLKKRPDYKQYQKQTSMLLILPKKKSK